MNKVLGCEIKFLLQVIVRKSHFDPVPKSNCENNNNSDLPCVYVQLFHHVMKCKISKINVYTLQITNSMEGKKGFNLNKT